MVPSAKDKAAELIKRYGNETLAKLNDNLDRIKGTARFEYWNEVKKEVENATAPHSKLP